MLPRLSRRSLLAAPLLCMPFVAGARAAGVVRLGQATTSLSFLPIWAARARDDFAKQGVTLNWAAIPGGDPATLAALDSGDLDLAAVGGETALQAIGKGQPFSVIMSLMSRMSLNLVVGPGVKATPADPLPARLAALKGMIVGVSAVGGTQDRAVRWLASQGGLARTEVQVAMVGGPPALQAALENKRIDAFMLSPPEAQIAEAGGYGRALIDLAADFPALELLPFLVLVARRPFSPSVPLQQTVQSLQAAAAAVATDPAATAGLIATKYFPRLAPGIVDQAVAAMKDGVASPGALSQPGIDAMVCFAQESGNPVGTLPPGAWSTEFIGGPNK